MADNCTLQVVNCTSQPLIATYRHSYQMETWSFANIGNVNFQEFPVSFFDGSHDEDDGAEQNFGYSGTDIMQIQARSDDHSNHYLNVQALATGFSTIVLVTNGSGMVLGPMQTNQLAWMSLTAATGSVLIGNLDTNQATLGVGLVDLSLLFSDPNEEAVYQAAIASGNLTYAQGEALSSALQAAIEGKPATAPGAVASK